MHLVAFVFGVGCAAADGAAEPDAPVADGADPDHLAPFAASTTWSVDEMEAAVQGLLDLGFPTPRAAYDAYRALMAQGDGACPTDPTQLIGQEMAVGGCTAESGVHYEGNTTLVEIDTRGEAGAQRGFQLAGDFAIDDTEGYRLEGGGMMLHGVQESPDGARVWTAQVAGTWTHTRRDDWLGRGVSATLIIGGASGSTDDFVSVDGTLGVDDVHVEFIDVRWDAACGGYPTGSVAVRDPSGLWGTLAFGDRCDGCGDWTVDATGETGEACLELHPYAGGAAELGTW